MSREFYLFLVNLFARSVTDTVQLWREVQFNRFFTFSLRVGVSNLFEFCEICSVRLCSEYTFAVVDNLDHCTKYLNKTPVTFGFPASLDLFATGPVSVARTYNCIYLLLQQRHRDIEFRESTNGKRQR
ncbi:putative afadin/alpha-actinin-binding protein [Helianthus anomalus]